VGSTKRHGILSTTTAAAAAHCARPADAFATRQANSPSWLFNPLTGPRPVVSRSCPPDWTQTQHHCTPTIASNTAMATLLRFSRPWRSLALRPTRPSSLPSKFFSHRSVPPRPRVKPPPAALDRSDANHCVLYLLIGVNVTGYGYSIYLRQAAKQGDVQPFVHFIKNMTLNYNDFRAGYWWQALTCNYTHLEFTHAFCNLVTTYFIGQVLAAIPVITPGRFFVIAVCGGLGGSAVHLYNKHRLQAQHGTHDNSRALGFSGAVMSMSTVAACLAPRARMMLYGVIPIPLWALVAGYAAYDGYYFSDTTSRTTHAGHIGGFAFGLLYYVFGILRPRMGMRR